MKKVECHEDIDKKCPYCARLLKLGHKDERNFIVPANGKEMNVLYCEHCWYDEPYQPKAENKN